MERNLNARIDGLAKWADIRRMEYNTAGKSDIDRIERSLASKIDLLRVENNVASLDELR